MSKLWIKVEIKATKGENLCQGGVQIPGAGGGGGTRDIYWWGCALAHQKRGVLGAGTVQKGGVLGAGTVPKKGGGS